MDFPISKGTKVFQRAMPAKPLKLLILIQNCSPPQSPRCRQRYFPKIINTFDLNVSFFPQSSLPFMPCMKCYNIFSLTIGIFLFQRPNSKTPLTWSLLWTCLKLVIPLPMMSFQEKKKKKNIRSSYWVVLIFHCLSKSLFSHVHCWTCFIACR